MIDDNFINKYLFKLIAIIIKKYNKNYYSIIYYIYYTLFLDKYNKTILISDYYYKNKILIYIIKYYINYFYYNF